MGLTFRANYGEEAAVQMPHYVCVCLFRTVVCKCEAFLLFVRCVCCCGIIDVYIQNLSLLMILIIYL